MKGNADGHLENSFSLHDRGHEDTDEDEDHERVDDVEEVWLPRGPARKLLFFYVQGPIL